jgi:hypothetical protein
VDALVDPGIRVVSTALGGAIPWVEPAPLLPLAGEGAFSRKGRRIGAIFVLLSNAGENENTIAPNQASL